MTVVKPTQTMLDSIEKDVIGLRRSLAHARAIIDLKDNPAWEAMKETVREKLGMVEYWLDSFNGRSHADLSALLQQRVDMKMFLSMADDMASDMGKLEAKLSQRERDLDEYRERLRISRL